MRSSSRFSETAPSRCCLSSTWKNVAQVSSRLYICRSKGWTEISFSVISSSVGTSTTASALPSTITEMCGPEKDAGLGLVDVLTARSEGDSNLQKQLVRKSLRVLSTLWLVMKM